MNDDQKVPAGPDTPQTPETPAPEDKTGNTSRWSRLKIFWRGKIKAPLLTLGEQSWRGAVAGAIAAYLVALLFFGTLGRTGLGMVPDALIMALVGVLVLYLTWKLVEWLWPLLLALPVRFVAVVGAALAILAATGFPLVVPFLLAGIIAGAAVGAARRRGWKRFSSVVLILIPVGIYGFFGVNLLRNGEDPYPDLRRAPDAAGVPTLAAANPSLPGQYKFKALTYGSGVDRHRQEYGRGAALRTQPVDATPLLDETSGFQPWMRELYWGFTPKNLPLNGRVWYPQGAGPFPLVLIVHGNHDAKEFSDPGYAYLGELLASRGFIAVSVDENFLNGDWFGDYQQRENPVRGWLLLQHLKAWRGWNATPGNPFRGKVNLDRVALIGHSRGGQAVALAAAFNPLPCHPEKTDLKFDFQFGIRGIVEIAPNDPAKLSGKPVELRDLHYLLLQGGYDSDVTAFYGDRQYHRVDFSGGGDWLKAALYLYRANHGQFNTVWGRTDYGPPQAWLLNLEPLLSGEEQRQAAKVYIGAFLETALRDDRAYRAMFRDWRVARGWLPADRYISQFQAASQRLVADFEEDIDVTTTSLPGGRIRAENLTAWSENALVLRDDTPQNTKGVFLGWDRESLEKKAPKDGKAATAAYTIDLPDPLPADWALSPGCRVVFALANNKVDVAKTDLSVELVSAGGAAARLPLSRFAPVCPPLKTRLTKWPMEDYIHLSRPADLVLQTFSLPLADFVADNGAFDPARLRTIRFVFDRTPSGEVALDNIGLELE